MKLFVYEKFYDALLGLDRTTQKKVIQFKRKFQENRDSGAIHLESISTFKDPSLRTARIDGKYRAILKKSSDDTYYLLWVANHDEAMDWARNKRFDWNEHTNAMQVFSVEEVVEAEQFEHGVSPEVVVDGILAAYKDTELQAIGVPSPLLPAVRRIRDLSGLELLEAHLPRDAFENIFYLMDGEPIDRIIEEVAEGAKLADHTSINNGRSFVEVLEDEVLERALAGSSDKWRYFLHPSQRALVEGNYKGSVKVSGGAGTGKTVAALHRLRHLALTKSDPRPVLFTTFTKALTDNLKDLVESLGVSDTMVRVTNIDKLGFQLAKDHGLLQPTDRVFEFHDGRRPVDYWDEVLATTITDFEASWLAEEYAKVILLNNISDLASYLRVPRTGRGKAISRRQRAEIWSLVEKYKALKSGFWHIAEIYNLVTNDLNNSEDRRPFSHAVVDELQDLSNVELRMIRAMVDEGPNDLMLVGDPMQSIYLRSPNFSKSGIHIRGKRSKRLRINYRTTEEIKRLAISVVSDVSFDDFDGGEESKRGYISLIRGERPKYHIFDSRREELAFIIDQIQQLLQSHQVLPSEIVIGCRLSKDVAEFASALHKSGIPKYVSRDGRSQGSRDGVRVMTLHSMKGLEFRHVFLGHVSADTAPLVRTPSSNSEEALDLSSLERSEKSLYYVAASRAIEHLTLTGHGKPSRWFNHSA